MTNSPVTFDEHAEHAEVGTSLYDASREVSLWAADDEEAFWATSPDGVIFEDEPEPERFDAGNPYGHIADASVYDGDADEFFPVA